MNAPDPRHWTLNSCFTSFSTIWLYLGLFLYYPKQGTKGAEMVQLMQSFVPHRNFSQQSQLICTIGPKTQIFVNFVMLRCIWDRFVTVWNSVQHINAKVLATKSSWFFFATNTPDPRHWTLNSCFGAFFNVLGAFGTVLLLHKTRCRTGRTGATNTKVHAMKSHQKFWQRTNPIHNNRP